MERKRTFIDGMESVSLTDGMIRMELYNIVIGRNRDSAENPHEVCEELIMTPQSFIKIFSTMENLVQKLAEAGIVKKNEVKQTSEEKQNTELSPNFQ